MLARLGISALVVLALAGGFWFKRGRGPSVSQTSDRQGKQVEVQKKTQDKAAPKLTKDSGDDSLDKDITAIEAELKLLEQEESKVDQGLNDKQIPIEE